jgi:hypothetical protein
MQRYPTIHERRSIFAHIRAHAPADQLGLFDGGEALPDEDKVRASTRVPWASGALDGVATHHMGGNRDADLPDQLAAAVVSAIEKPNRRRLRSLYALFEPVNALDVVDSLIDALRRRGVSRNDINEFSAWLATTAPDREPVKLGIALLGVAGLNPPDLEIVRLLGRHEEFTLYAAVALRNGLQNSDPELFALAHHVNGWGRIQLVERLAATSDATIKRWILREGFRNAIMYEYLAYTAATTGDLAGELASGAPDRELLTAAGELLTALFNGGPAQNIDDYADGAVATESFISHMLTRAETLGDGLATWEVEKFVARDGEWGDRIARGWTVERRAMLARGCAQVLDAPSWATIVLDGLRSDEQSVVWRADQLALRVGVDPYPAHRARLDINILDSWA